MLYLKLLRVNQWIKNTFLFIPIFFAGHAIDFNQYKFLIPGFFSFSFVASAIYILNDICDRTADQNHPKKKFRPIASGKVSILNGYIIMILLLVIGLGMAFWIDQTFFLLLVVYLLINIGYSFGLKNLSIVDIFAVASGFIIRIYAGGILADTPVSHWLAVMVLLLSLFLALAKRRDDLVITANGGINSRKSVKQYNLEFINSCLSIFAGVIIVAYILYTLSPEVTARFETEWLFSTTTFVIAGIMRYLQITFVDQQSGNPTQILYKDKFILITIFGWIMSFYLIIYVA